MATTLKNPKAKIDLFSYLISEEVRLAIPTKEEIFRETVNGMNLDYATDKLDYYDLIDFANSKDSIISSMAAYFFVAKYKHQNQTKVITKADGTDIVALFELPQSIIKELAKNPFTEKNTLVAISKTNKDPAVVLNATMSAKLIKEYKKDISFKNPGKGKKVDYVMLGSINQKMSLLTRMPMLNKTKTVIDLKPPILKYLKDVNISNYLLDLAILDYRKKLILGKLWDTAFDKEIDNKQISRAFFNAYNKLNKCKKITLY